MTKDTFIFYNMCSGHNFISVVKYCPEKMRYYPIFSYILFAQGLILCLTLIYALCLMNYFHLNYHMKYFSNFELLKLNGTFANLCDFGKPSDEEIIYNNKYWQVLKWKTNAFYILSAHKDVRGEVIEDY